MGMTMPVWELCGEPGRGEGVPYRGFPRSHSRAASSRCLWPDTAATLAAMRWVAEVGLAAAAAAGVGVGRAAAAGEVARGHGLMKGFGGGGIAAVARVVRVAAPAGAVLFRGLGVGLAEVAAVAADELLPPETCAGEVLLARALPPTGRAPFAAIVAGRPVAAALDVAAGVRATVPAWACLPATSGREEEGERDCGARGFRCSCCCLLLSLCNLANL